jgi:hypothetical protein
MATNPFEDKWEEGEGAGQLTGVLVTVNLSTLSHNATLSISPFRLASYDGILEHQFNKKSRVFCSMLFTVRFYWRISKKTILFTGFKNLYKKSTKQENSSQFLNSNL